MYEKHQWMPNTLFDMAALCDRNGMDQPRDLLLEAAMAISDYLNSSCLDVGQLPSYTGVGSGICGQAT